MDISAPLIFISLFLVACLSLFLVYKFGIKEKSYEEALAEQRQQTNALLGVKPKPKEKKNKKAAKKSKEKQSHQDNETDESENVETINIESSQAKLHVEFKEKPEEVPAKEVVQAKKDDVFKAEPVKDKTSKKKDDTAKQEPAKEKASKERKDDAVKQEPIKEKPAKERKDDVVKQEPIKEKAPKEKKDDAVKQELVKEKPAKERKDDTVKQEAVKEKVAKEKKSADTVPPSKNNKKVTKHQNSSNNVVEPAPTLVIEKEKEKEKLEESAAKAVPVVPQTNGVVGNPGKEKKKKKSEFNTRQQLTAERDGLINSVRNAELSKTEVQLLIDLLLNKQLEAPAVIGDWSEGKSDPVQKLKKQLVEKEKALAEEQEALSGVQAKLKEIRAEQQTEKIQLQQKIRGLEEMLQAKQIEMQATNNRLQVNTQKIQQLQTELNAEIKKTHKVIEDNSALEMQTKQFEVRIAQIQETDGIIAKQRNDIEELSAQNQQLRLEMQQSATDNQHYLIQLGNLEKALEQQNEHNRQLKEEQQELERNLEISIRQENDWKIEISNLNTALQQRFEEQRRLEHAMEQLNEELCKVTNEKVESAKIIAQLNSELQQVQEEQMSQVNGSSEKNKAHEVEILNLTNELSSVRNELSSMKIELQQTEKKYKKELESSDVRFGTIQVELEKQKAKNDELRTKNWKVMEALNAAEGRSKAHKQTEVNLDKLASEIHAKEQDSQKQFIQRLFPEIEDLKAVTSEDWQAEFGKLIRNYVGALKTQKSPEGSREVAELQAQLQHYKIVIDDTEGMLNKLQRHTEKEEIDWRNQLAAKEAEIENLKEAHSLQLQTKVSSLEQQLNQEIDEKQRLSQECQILKGRKPPPAPQSDATVTIERLSEEVNRLREQLRVEQIKNGDESVCLKAQSNYNNSTSTNGPTFIEGTGN